MELASRSISSRCRNYGIAVVFKHCVRFTDSMSEINNAQVDNAKDIDIVIPIYNLVEFSDNYSQTSRSLWQYYRVEPVLTDAGILANFPGNSDSFKNLNKK